MSVSHWKKCNRPTPSDYYWGGVGEGWGLVDGRDRILKPKQSVQKRFCLNFAVNWCE